MPDSLRSLSDREILDRTRQLTIDERAVTIKLLLHLNEVERRELYLSRGYPSLFEYCTSDLGYSTAAAVRRIQTARCVARFPQVLDMLERNEVNLSTVSRVSKLLTSENADAVLDRIRNQSQRQVESVVAGLDPLAVVPRDRVRTIVVRVPVAETGYIRNGCETRSTSGPHLDGTADSHVAHGEASVASGGEPVLPNLIETAITFEKRSVVQFAAREDVMSRLERVRSIAAHRLAGKATWEEVIDLLARYFIEREDPAKREERRESRRSTRPRSSETQGKPRQIPARIRDQVFVRDNHQCTFVAANSRRCASTHMLQVDHIVPVARGGASTIDNLRLLCAKHNRMEAERLMGEGICAVPS